jgi:hypothetical protein
VLNLRRVSCNIEAAIWELQETLMTQAELHRLEKYHAQMAKHHESLRLHFRDRRLKLKTQADAKIAEKKTQDILEQMKKA